MQYSVLLSVLTLQYFGKVGGRHTDFSSVFVAATFCLKYF